MSEIQTASAKTYVVDKDRPFLYPGAGDPSPAANAKVQLLTVGGVCVTGQWGSGEGFMGWCPLPCRDMEKEQLLKNNQKNST
jgi:hypothetical protein